MKNQRTSTKIAGGLFLCTLLCLSATYADGQTSDSSDEKALTPTLSLKGDDIPLLQCARLLFIGREYRSEGLKYDAHSPLEPVDTQTEWLIRDAQSRFEQRSIEIREATYPLKIENEPRRSQDYDGWLAQAREIEKAEAAQIDDAVATTYLELLESVERKYRLWLNEYIRGNLCGSASLHTNGSTWNEAVFKRSAAFELKVEEVTNK